MWPSLAMRRAAREVPPPAAAEKAIGRCIVGGLSSTSGGSGNARDSGRDVITMGARRDVTLVKGVLIGVGVVVRIILIRDP